MSSSEIILMIYIIFSFASKIVKNEKGDWKGLIFSISIDISMFMAHALL